MQKDDVLQFAKKQYGDEPDYPWKDEPNYAVLRHPNNQKWYALIMKIPKSRLGAPSEENVFVLNVKCEPALIDSLTGQEGIFPAYHMNRSHWISILLDGGVPLAQVLDLLDRSYDLTRRKVSPRK